VGFRRNTLRVVSLRAFVFLFFRHGLLLLRVVSCCVSLTAAVAVPHTRRSSSLCRQK
jgi:hypothetical protein